LILLGYFKKLVLADNLAPVVESVFGGITHGIFLSNSDILTGIYAFPVQIYCDFSGYSDIARGVSYLLGIQLVENFKQPFLSRNITEFWTRWHVSLSFWLRDYLYIPLGGSRHGLFRTCLSLMLTMLLAGLWHGAAWTYVLFGAIHGVFLVVERLAGIRAQQKKPFNWSHLIFCLWTYHVFTFSLVVFRASSISSALELFGSLSLDFTYVKIWPLLLVLVAYCSVLLIDLPFVKRSNMDKEALLDSSLLQSLFVCGLLAFSLAFFPPSENPSFIYFQF
jgi:D-alanyl-lipoteichoic acid acyltransferase DltB (MBOAT superfamily)